MPWPVVLASASPRRQELLAQIVDAFEVLPAGIDEKSVVPADPIDLARTLATRKAEVVFELRAGAMVIGADTIVVLDPEVLNKPVDVAQAREMLAALSGRTHIVITGIALMWPPDERIVFADSAKVTFRTLTAPEIDAYVASGEPMDKAGAYAIQGGAAKFVTALEGDRDTVIGLPTKRIHEFLGNIANKAGSRSASPP